MQSSSKTKIVDENGKPFSIGEVSGRQQEVFECAECKVKTQHNLVQSGPTFKASWNFGSKKKQHLVDFPRTHYVYRCCACQSDTYFLIQEQHTFRMSEPGRSWNETMPSIVVHRFPRYIAEVHESVPNSVRKNLLEAETCFAAGAPNAAGTMARRAVDEIVRLRKGTGANLYQRLESLRTGGLVSQELIDMAHQIRDAGRNGAHAEWKELTHKQAQVALFLLKELVRELYITPVERKQRRQQFGTLKKKP